MIMQPPQRHVDDADAELIAGQAQGGRRWTGRTPAMIRASVFTCNAWGDAVKVPSAAPIQYSIKPSTAVPGSTPLQGRAMLSSSPLQ